MISTDTDLETDVTLETTSRVVDDDLPFRLLVLGNWSGREYDGKRDISSAQPIVIDRDNFDEVLKKLNVSVDLCFDGDDSEVVSLRFEELDDFHPDKIFKQVPLFSKLRDIRRRLLNESTFNLAANDVRNMFENDLEVSIEPEVIELDGDIKKGLLDNILDQPTGGGVPTRPQTTHSKELSAFLAKVVRSHVITTDESEQARLLNLVDEASSELMRLIIHHPHFKALESAWRGVYLLVRKIETDVDLKIYLIDACKSALANNLKKVNSLAESAYYKWTVRDAIETPGAEPWSLVCGNYSFDVNVEDAAMLMRLAKISEAANAPFVSHITSIGGMGSFASFDDNSVEGKLWATIRTGSEAAYLGLAAPRFLARLPYGAETDPIDEFLFEEFRGPSEHEIYLWCNPSILCAILFAQSYRMYGWDMSGRIELNMSGLPTHIFVEDGETVTKPCAEFLMTEPVCMQMLDLGIMPLISFKNSDRVQLGRIQSVAFPSKLLAGKWR